MIFAFCAMIFVTYTMTQRMFRIILSFVCFMSPYCLLIALIQRGLVRWPTARLQLCFYESELLRILHFVILFCIYNRRAKAAACRSLTRR